MERARWPRPQGVVVRAHRLAHYKGRSAVIEWVQIVGENLRDARGWWPYGVEGVMVYITRGGGALGALVVVLVIVLVISLVVLHRR